MSHALAALLLILQTDAQDERIERVMRRVEKEIRDSQARLREDIAKIIRSEMAKARAPEEKEPVYLGITAGDLTEEDLKSLDGKKAIKIAEVAGPAKEAGLRAGDILVKIDGREVGEENILETLQRYKPGDQVDVTLLREGKSAKLKLTLARRER